MEITVKLFAFLQDRLGPTVTVRVSSPVKVADLFDQVAKQDPTLEPTLNNSRLAVNQEFVDAATVTLTPTDEVAIIPPVSGG